MIYYCQDDVKDILLEAEDEGFDAQVYISKFHSNRPFFTVNGLPDGWVSELRYSIVIHIVKKGLKQGQSMFANNNYFDINIIKEPLKRLEGYVKLNLPPDYKLRYTDGVNAGFEGPSTLYLVGFPALEVTSKATLVTMTINNYELGK